MTHFAQSLQQPINPQIQKLIDIDFNVFILYEDHGINSLQTYIQKMGISANSRGLWGDNCAIFVWKIIYIGPSMFGQKKLCDMLSSR
jgi:hypothetical protein